MIRHTLLGGAAGFILGAAGFGLMHHALFGDDPARHAEGFTRDRGPSLVVSGLGAIAGTYAGGRAGSAHLPGAVGRAVRGALAGVAVVGLLGLASSATRPPKQDEAHKALWLRYGVPVGTLIGALIGLVSTSRTAPGPDASARLDGPGLDGRRSP